MLRNYFPHFIKEKSGMFGVEIETEVETYGKYPSGFFRMGSTELSSEEAQEHLHEDNELNVTGLPEFVAKHDGSLRHFGVEYVFKQPLSYEKTLSVLNKFDTVTTDIPFLEDQASTSVHVHLNVSEYSLSRLGNILTLWALYENVIVSYCDDFRHTNLFALPIRCAEATVDHAVKMFIGCNAMGVHSINIEQQHSKYAALNLSALARFGSLEFRSLEGVISSRRIKPWIEVLKQLHELSGMFDNPYKILEAYRSDPDFLLDFLVGHIKSDLIEKGVDFNTMTRRNLWYAGQIAMSIDDWADLDERWAARGSKKEKPKGLTLDDALNDIYGWSEPVPTPSPWVNSQTEAFANIAQTYADFLVGSNGPIIVDEDLL